MYTNYTHYTKIYIYLHALVYIQHVYLWIVYGFVYYVCIYAYMCVYMYVFEQY